jgi:hypothetical protein
MVNIHSTVLALSMKHYLRKWLNSFDKEHKDLYKRFEQYLVGGTSRYKRDTVMAYLISLVSKMDYYVVSEAVNYAFTWSDTTEGHGYWSSINDEWFYVGLPRFYKSIPESMRSLTPK